MHRLFLIICCFLMASILFMISHGMAAHRFLAGVPSGTGQSKGGTHGSPSQTAPSEGQRNSPPAAARTSPTGSRYVNYGALKRNTRPCSRRGASYYNCKGSNNGTKLNSP